MLFFYGKGRNKLRLESKNHSIKQNSLDECITKLNNPIICTLQTFAKWVCDDYKKRGL